MCRDEQVVEVWRLEDGKLQTRIDLPTLTTDAKFTHDGQQLVVLLVDESVRLYDVTTDVDTSPSQEISAAEQRTPNYKIRSDIPPVRQQATSSMDKLSWHSKSQ